MRDWAWNIFECLGMALILVGGLAILFRVTLALAGEMIVAWRKFRKVVKQKDQPERDVDE
jgi:hypothetical protein